MGMIKRKKLMEEISVSYRSVGDLVTRIPINQDFSTFGIIDILLSNSLFCAVWDVQQQPWPLLSRCQWHPLSCDNQNVSTHCQKCPGVQRGELPLTENML